MKVYVDELPSCCEDCVCHNGVSGRCKLLHRTTFDIPPRDCPLQSLTDYTKQVRKEIVQEVKSLIDKYIVSMNSFIDDYGLEELIKDINQIGETK